MITDLDSPSNAQHAVLGRPQSRRSSARSLTGHSLRDEVNSIYTQFILHPSAQPAHAFPWFSGVLDGLSEPLSRYHE